MARQLAVVYELTNRTQEKLFADWEPVFGAQSGAGFRLNFWKWFDESRYPGALSSVLEKLSSWVSEDALGTAVILRRNEKQTLCKTLGANKVHYRRCARLQVGNEKVKKEQV